MYYFNFFIIFLVGIGGLCLGVVGFREYTNITRTAEKVSALQIIKIALLFGVSGSLILFTVMIFAGVFDDEYIWSLQKLGNAFLVSLIPGIIIILGVVYQIYTTVVFRDMLIKKYKEKDKPENHND